MDRSAILALLKELAASAVGVHAEVGIGGAHPNDETFLQLTSLSNRDEYAIVSVDAAGWFQLEVSGGFYHAQANDLASDETLREYLAQYFQAALAYLAGHWSTRTSRLFRLPIVVVDSAVDLFGQPLALGLRVRDSWRMLSRRPPRASFSDEHSNFAPVTDDDRANFPIPLLPTVGFCRAGEYQGLYLFSGLLNVFPVAERMWDIVVAGGGPGGDDELFFAEDGLGVATVRDLDIEWAPAHLQNVARRELFHGLRIDEPIQHPSGWESDGDQSQYATRVAADGPWARFEQPA